MATKNAKQELFEKAVKNVNKNLMTQRKSDEDVLAIFGDKPKKVPTISTGSIVLDSLIGGGFPKGRMIEIYGPEASGKTSISLTAAANVQAEGGTVAFVDLEHALDPAYATKLGVDVPSMAFSQPSDAQQALQTVAALAKTEAVDMIIVDSIAAMVPREILEGSTDDNTMALLARLMSTNVPKVATIAAKSGTTIVFINQVREAVGVMFGNPETTPGGKAMKFAASQRIRVSKVGKPVTDEKGDPIGSEVRFNITKNKIGAPYKKGETVLTFNHGINVANELVEIGPKIGVIEKPTNRSWVNPITQKKFATSKAEAVKALESDEELFNSIADQVYAYFTGDAMLTPTEDTQAEGDGENSEDSGNDDDVVGTVDTETGEILDDENEE